MDLNSVNITATQVAKNYFSAYVENGFIYSYSVYGERQIGALSFLSSCSL